MTPRPIAKTELRELRRVDRALFRIGKEFELLDKLKWSASTKTEFLRSWRNRRAELPRVEYPVYRLKEQRTELREIIRAARSSSPLARLIRETAESYHTALRMLEAIGTSKFLELSTNLYGSPNKKVDLSGGASLRAAHQFLRAMRRFDLAEISPPENCCLLPDVVVKQIRDRAEEVFFDRKIQVRKDSKLASKASAGPSRIRVRTATCFAPHDVEQLVQHELLVHTLTLLNGRQQKLRTLGLNSPRTTCSQEGLAVFAELITNAMDVSRLMRISARVQAIHMGIEGADFIDIFRFFLEHGQSEDESYFSAVRIFRGGKVTGGVVFTKDIAYLKGLIEVHQFFLSALKDKKFLFPHYIFSGRMKTQDVEELVPYFEDGSVSLPRYEPGWISNRSTLLAFLLSSSVMNSLGLGQAVK